MEDCFQGSILRVNADSNKECERMAKCRFLKISLNIYYQFIKTQAFSKSNLFFECFKIVLGECFQDVILRTNTTNADSNEEYEGMAKY